jgi:hypothetical protein
MARKLRSFRKIAILVFVAAFVTSASRGARAGGWNVDCWGGNDVYVWGGVGSGISCSNAMSVCSYGCESCYGNEWFCSDIDTCYLDEVTGSCTF